MNIKLLEVFLKDKAGDNDIDYWKIIHKEQLNCNSYYIIDFEPESVFRSLRDEFEITVEKKEGEQAGKAVFTLSVSADETELEQSFANALIIIEENKNPAYPHPGAGDSLTDDSKIDYSIFEDKTYTQSMLSGEIFKKHETVKERFKSSINNFSFENLDFFCNYLEIFSNHTKEHLISANGIDKQYATQSGYCEYALTAKDGDQETEHLVYQPFGNIFSEDLTEDFKTELLICCDTIRCGAAENYSGPVVLAKGAARDFFRESEIPTPAPLRFKTSAMAKFQGMTDWETGHDVSGSKADLLTFSFNPLLKNARMAVPFDNEGISANKVTVIEKGKVQKFAADSQYGHYQNLSVTGNWKVIEVEGGSSSADDLMKGDRIEIISFSAFTPNFFNGSISAEIRLGYIHKNGKKTPFKGGLFTGNYFDLLKKAMYSRETTLTGNYRGPDIIRFSDADLVAG